MESLNAWPSTWWWLFEILRLPTFYILKKPNEIDFWFYHLANIYTYNQFDVKPKKNWVKIVNDSSHDSGKG